jgi:hypothetical protein
VTITPETLAWLHQSATVKGSTYSQVLLHLLDRVEALERRPIPGFVELAAPTPEAAPVATDKELVDEWGAQSTVKGALRSCYDLGRQHGAAQPPAAQPTPQPAHPNHEGGEYTDQEWAEIKRWRQESPTPQPAPPAAPAGGLVERVAEVISTAEGDGNTEDWTPEARAAIREVAAWMRENEVGYDAVRWLEHTLYDGRPTGTGGDANA